MEKSIPYESLLDRLGKVPDPRSRHGRMYPLSGLLAMLILGALHGERSLRGMWMWASKRWSKIAWPLGFFGNPRPPVYATVWYVVSELDAEVVEGVFRDWTASWSQEEVQAISVDGKALRGSRRVNPPERALEVVTAVGQGLKVVLGQQEVSLGDQLGAALRLLRATPLEGKVVIADAGLLCRPFVNTVLDGGGDYVGVIKDNQPQLKAAIDDWVDPDISPSGQGASSGCDPVGQGARAD